MRSLKSAITMMLGVVAALAFLVVPAMAAPPAEAELLKNGDFEGGTYIWNNDPVVTPPNDWAPWWQDPGRGGSQPDQKPRYNPSDAQHRIYSGVRAASYWEQYRNYDAGLLQVVENATPGTKYRFTIWGHAWSVDDTSKNTSTSVVELWACIDPNGGQNIFSSSVVCDGPKSAMDAYQQFSVEATAGQNKITVFVRSRTTFPVVQSDTYWDKGSLVAVGQGEQPTSPPSTQQPTQPPSGGGSGAPAGSIPKSTPAPDGSIVHIVSEGETLIGIAVTYDVTLEELRSLNDLKSDMIYVGQRLIIKPPGAQPTEEPAQQPTPTAAPEVVEGGGEALPQGNGTICVLLYEDLNGNGLREAGEPGLAGATFSLNDGAQMVGMYTTDGSGVPYCFADLTPGTYIVTWVADNLAETSERTWAVSVAGGSTVSREFGAVSTGGADAAGGGGGSGLPTWATALIGALGVIFFLSGLGAAGYFLIIRRAQVK